jgi:hypothetical protein
MASDMASDDAKLASEARMQAADAIMEPGIDKIVMSYIHKDGGKPRDAIDMLAQSYTGAEAAECLQI